MQFSDITLLNKILADAVDTDQEIGEKLLGEIDTKLGMLRDKCLVDISAYTEALFNNKLKPLRGRALYPIQCKVSAFVQEQLAIKNNNDEQPGRAAEPQPAAAAAANGGAAAAAPARAAAPSRAERARRVQENYDKKAKIKQAKNDLTDWNVLKAQIDAQKTPPHLPADMQQCYYPDLTTQEASRLLNLESVPCGSYVVIARPSQPNFFKILIKLERINGDTYVHDDKSQCWIFNKKYQREAPSGLNSYDDLDDLLKGSFRIFDIVSEFVPLEPKNAQEIIANELVALRAIANQ